MRTQRFLAGAAAALLVLGACGGSDDDSAADEPVTTIGEGETDTADVDDTDEPGGGDSGSSDADPAASVVGSDGGGVEPGEVCSLFTPGDAEAAAGTELELAAEQVAGGCVYSAVDETTMAFVNVTYTPSALSAETTLEQIAAMLLGYGSPAEAGPQIEEVGSIDGALAMDVFGVPTVVLPNGSDMVAVIVMGGDMTSTVGLAEVIAGNL